MYVMDGPFVTVSLCDDPSAIRVSECSYSYCLMLVGIFWRCVCLLNYASRPAPRERVQASVYVNHILL